MIILLRISFKLFWKYQSLWRRRLWLWEVLQERQMLKYCCHEEIQTQVLGKTIISSFIIKMIERVPEKSIPWKMNWLNIYFSAGQSRSQCEVVVKKFVKKSVSRNAGVKEQGEGDLEQGFLSPFLSFPFPREWEMVMDFCSRTSCLTTYLSSVLSLDLSLVLLDSLMIILEKSLAVSSREEMRSTKKCHRKSHRLSLDFLLLTCVCLYSLT